MVNCNKLEMLAYALCGLKPEARIEIEVGWVLFLLQLSLPVLYQRQRLRATFAGADGDEAPAIARGRVFAGNNAAQGKAEELFTACDLESRS